MNSSPRRLHASARPRSQQPQGSWVSSKGISYAEPFDEDFGSQFIQPEVRGRSSPMKSGTKQRNNSWAYEKQNTTTAGVSGTRNGNGRDMGYQTMNTATMNSYTPQGYQYHERESIIQYAEHNPMFFALKPSQSMIAEDIEDESSSPMKPNPTMTSKRFTNDAVMMNENWDYILDDSPPKAKRVDMQQHLDLNTFRSNGISTGLSGNEETPSNVEQRGFKFPNNVDFLDFDDTSVLPSDLELQRLASTEKFDSATKMELERGFKSIEDELAEFDPVIDPCGIDGETIEHLAQQEKLYSPDPHYLKNKQQNINWNMRAILVDWMLEVSMEFTLKRETFHYGLNYVDRFLSLYPSVQKQELQLIGVAALFIAAKYEEIYSFKVNDFAKSCDGAYTPEQITHTEMAMLKTLKWMLVPPTLNTWAQWYLSQWDLYIEKSAYAIEHPLAKALGKDALIQFKQPNEKSYAIYREIMQYIDCLVLEVEHLQYNKRTLVAGLIYLVLGKQYKQFTVKHITEEFPVSSVFLLDKRNAYNDLFADFLGYIFGFTMEELLPSIQYAAPFFKLPLNYDMPRAVQVKGNQIIEVKYFILFRY